MPEHPRKYIMLLPSLFNAEGTLLRAAGRVVAQRNAILTPSCFCLGAAGAVACECSQRSGLKLSGPCQG